MNDRNESSLSEAPAAQEGDFPLPFDVRVAHIVFKKGVMFSTFLGAARRWHRYAAESAGSGAFLDDLAAAMKGDANG
jgi:hypothetical protein